MICSHDLKKGYAMRFSLLFKLPLTLFSLCTLLMLHPSRGEAMGGHLRTFDPLDLSSNWKVTDPKIVIAYGYFEPFLMKRYTRFFRGEFERKIKEINPALQIEIIPEKRKDSQGPTGATGAEIIQALQNPNTVGFIFISHTFKTQHAGTSISLGGDRHPLPVGIFSAATPALRFAAMLGCNGPGILTEYEIKYAFDQLPGRQSFYYNQDKLLSANFLGIDHLRKILRKIAQDLNHLEMMDFAHGQEPLLEPAGTLTLRVKDVYPQLEPRYVYVNGKIIGMLGATPETSNHDKGYEEFTYPIPHTAKRRPGTNCDRIKVMAAELSPGAPADNYLLESAQINWVDSPQPSVRTYSPPLHLGVHENREFHPNHGMTLTGTRDERLEQYFKYITQSWISAEWLDRDPEVWKQSPLKARFFIDCIPSISP